MQFKSQHILALTVVLSTARSVAWADTSEDVAKTEQQLRGSQPAASAAPQRLMPAVPTQPQTQPHLLPASTGQQQPTPVVSGRRPSEARLRKNNPDFAAIIAKISLVGWNPGPTMIYQDVPAPGAAAAGSQLKGNAAVSDVSSQIQTLPFANLNGAESDRTQILEEFRCSRVVTRNYQRGQRRILVEAFSFPTSDGAYGAYYLLRHGASTVIKRGDASSEDDQSISFWKDRFYIHVYGTSEDDSESKDAVRLIADQLAADIVSEPASLPPMISRLPTFEKVRGSEKLVMGPISARRFFPAPYINTLQLDNASGAAVADYQMQFPYPERLKLLYVEYPNANAASSAFYDYTDNLHSTNKEASGERDPLESAAGLPASCLFKVSGGYMLCELRGQQLILISGARKKTSPNMLARQVY